MFKFIHAADIHIDSPLRGLEAYEGAPVDQIRGATREAFSNLVALAIEEQVAFVIIAGDLFDGTWQDMQTGLWTARQFRRLEKEDIAVYLVRGNHDALSKVRRSISWPGNVHEFSVNEPQTFLIETIGVALHGQGFERQECLDDLAASYPDPVNGKFNIGVLHTSLAGSPDHDTYAPTSRDVLARRDYDYWALGHVHQRSESDISDRPYIAYSGNTQGRHIKEQGAKGCLLITVDEEIKAVEFRATDVLRWYKVTVDLERTDSVADLLVRARDCLITCHEAGEGRFCAVRMVVQGACSAHSQLVRRAERAETIADLRNLANELDEEVWLEKIRFETSPVLDIDQMRSGNDLVGELLSDIDAVYADEDDLRSLASVLTPLADKASLGLKETQIDFDDLDQLRSWLRQAETILATQLAETSE